MYLGFLHVADRCGASLANVSRISGIVDHDGAILANVSKSPHVEGVGYQVSIFEECIGTFASARKHLFFTYCYEGGVAGC